MGESVNYHLKNKSKPLDISIPGQSPNPAICTWTVSSVVSSFLANKTLRMETRERFGCCFFFGGGGKRLRGTFAKKVVGKWLEFKQKLTKLGFATVRCLEKVPKKDSPKMVI